MPSASTRPRPLVLLIIDGYGISFVEEGNAIAAAKKPNIDRLMREYPLAAVKAAGIEVGLPWGEMGNSETGHQNIGSGRVIYQMLPRISLAIEDGSFFENPVLLKAAAHVKKTPGAALHTIGVLSNGGVHGHIDHQLALLKFAAQHGLSDRLYVHAFLDGRDSPPDSAGNFINQLDQAIQEVGAGRLSTMIGRYFAMDRANNWERTQKAYDLLVRGQGEMFPTWQEAAQAAYKETDNKSFEIAPPMMISQDGESPRLISSGDAVVFYNYRPDRAYQLAAAFTQKNFKEFPTEPLKNLMFATMGDYGGDLPVEVVFPKEGVKHPLAKTFAEYKLKQLRIAESEKFAHVTYFFNGGEEKPYPGEDRIEIPSLKIRDINKNPEMKAIEITDKVVETIQNGTHDVIIMNYANPDMVGHTGKFKATVQAVEIIDEQIGRVAEAALAAGGAVLITCDHGNAEMMIDQISQKKGSTDHTNSSVPVIYAAAHNRQDPPKGQDIVDQLLMTPIGVLADVAPTVLEILELPQPKDMTAQSLLNSLA